MGDHMAQRVASLAIFPIMPGYTALDSDIFPVLKCVAGICGGCIVSLRCVDNGTVFLSRHPKLYA